ncbi:hypothetical protein [Priestia koreensis]|uniref:hypothetical protein n=1 Tax=Priestia koreensis TaxID=284581 RepID=UPI001F598B15|nr:hypothetical protein [Priestia koreensis]MCM3006447.1 hypothetical protein [Priestia koreensis]UNL83652.1 hypothetical protein IE339_15960 [Priestia koreensis]
MKKARLILIMKLFALILLFGLIFFDFEDGDVSLTVNVVSASIIFIIFVLSDFFFEIKPWLLKGLQLYISIMFFIVAVIEMHEIISSVCALSIVLLPYLMNELK